MILKCTILMLTVVFTYPGLCAAKGRGPLITDTPHNLSITGGGGASDIKSSTQAEICIFCHTPHHATQAPLWSRDVPAETIYIPYASTTMKAPVKPGQPRASSRLCLSCHDGTIALGALGPLSGGLSLDSSLPKMPRLANPRLNANLGTDLSDDHPVSFPYPSVASNPELNDPATLAASGIKLSEGTYIECNSCHNPHNNQFGNFLVVDVSVKHDAMCNKCHNKAGWGDPDTAHRSGGTRYPTISGQVAADGCMSCHLPHNAQQGEHLLQLSAIGAGGATNCYVSCHQGAPYANIWAQINTNPYTHPVQNDLGTHKEDEQYPLVAASKHVTCADCHNPHQAGLQGAPLDSTLASTAPSVSGPIRGVRGVDATGTIEVAPATFEYQICLKCHAGGAAEQFTNFGYPPPQRVFRSYDESIRFVSSNPSYHPVTVDRTGTGASLLSQYQLTMIRIYCTDCHTPHGSLEPHMLGAQNWDTYPSHTIEYQLCFKCHDRTYLLNPASSPSSPTASLHKSHVLDHINQAPCSACHDPHGVPAVLGASTDSAAHLINFDKRYAGATPVYSSSARSCTVSCHLVNPKTY